MLRMLPLLGLLPPVQPHPHHLLLGPGLLHSTPGAQRLYHYFGVLFVFLIFIQVSTMK